MANRVLVIDDERLIRWSICERLSMEGFKCDEADSGAAAQRLAASQVYQLALVDLRLPDTDGLTLLEHLHQSQPHLPAIIITAYSTLESAIRAMKCGAKDYITKPFNMDDLVRTARSVLSSVQNSRRESQTAEHEQRARFGMDSLVGRSMAVQQLRESVRRAAESDASVLLIGESGSGKDTVARAIHYESKRSAMPFIPVSCSALADSLLTMELFGYEPGAFDGITAVKKGIFEIAAGGTVFLDEAESLSPLVQAGLSSILTESRITRLGGTASIPMEARIFAATRPDEYNRDRPPGFCADLYNTADAMAIYMPPLRDRQEDIPMLAAHFLSELRRSSTEPVANLSAAAIDKLVKYNWPGNVRELRNVVESAAFYCTGQTIEPASLHIGRTTGTSGIGGDYLMRLPDTGCNITDVERDLIRQALERTGWNQTRAARLIGYSRDQIRYKMEKFNLAPPEETAGVH